jgi:hypothetical protein
MNKNNNNAKEGNPITFGRVEDLISIPDKIIYYHHGKETIIEKGNMKFNTIITMAITRTDSIQDVCKLGLSESDIETQKQTNDVLEFAYSKKIAVNWKPPANNNFEYRFAYNAILFPLSGDWNRFMIFLPIQNGPLDPLESANNLQKYLNS